MSVCVCMHAQLAFSILYTSAFLAQDKMSSPVSVLLIKNNSSQACPEACLSGDSRVCHIDNNFTKVQDGGDSGGQVIAEDGNQIQKALSHTFLPDEL